MIDLIIGLSAQGCQIHADHRPGIDRDAGFTVDVHHIHPLGLGGKDSASNRVRICPTGHRAIHELLREYERHDGKVPWEIRRRYHPGERRYAGLGWEQITAYRATGQAREEGGSMPSKKKAEAEAEVEEVVLAPVESQRALLNRQDGRNRISRTSGQGGVAAAVVLIMVWAARLANMDLNPLPDSEEIPNEVVAAFQLLLTVGAAWWLNRGRLQGKDE